MICNVSVIAQVLASSLEMSSVLCFREDSFSWEPVQHYELQIIVQPLLGGRKISRTEATQAICKFQRKYSSAMVQPQPSSANRQIMAQLFSNFNKYTINMFCDQISVENRGGKL